MSKTKAQDVYVGGYDNSKVSVWKNGIPTYFAGDGDVWSVVVDNGNV